MDSRRIRWKFKCGVLGSAKVFGNSIWFIFLLQPDKGFSGWSWTALNIMIAILGAFHLVFAIWVTLHAFGWRQKSQEYPGRIYSSRGGAIAYALLVCLTLITQRYPVYATAVLYVLGGLGCLITFVGEIKEMKKNPS